MALFSKSHKGTVRATLAQVVEIDFSHPGNAESKVTPTEIQAVVLILTLSKHTLKIQRHFHAK